MVQVEELETADCVCTIGTRVDDGNGERGTVLYTGSITPDSSSLWLGIDWDDPSRGKHDGSYNNIRFFSARHPTSGSFVKCKKVQLGCSFLEAVKEKYAPAKPGQMDAVQLSGSKAIEFVGMDSIYLKQSQLDRLRELVLDESLVSYAGDDSSVIASIVPNVTELHMCHTLLSDWLEIERICKYLANLLYLNLSKNVFKPLELGSISHPLVNIRSLILTACRLDWKEVNSLAILFPNLSELGLCGNEIRSIDCIQYSKLASLDLEGNLIGQFTSILPLMHLKCLQVLNLTNTGLVDFVIPQCPDLDDGGAPFVSLKTLYLSKNAIQKWGTINELSKFPSLEHLLIRDNPPVMSESSATTRQFIIAKLKNLKSLDRQVIEPQERRGAEIDYLKRCGKERVEMSVKKFLEAHPRYEELCRKYGAPEQQEIGNNHNTGLLKNRIIDIIIQVPDRQTVINKKLPGSMTVQKVKALIGRTYSIDVRRLQLSYESSSRPGITISLDNDLRDLTFYSLGSGDKIYANILKS